ncbi:MAG TPA: peptidoglycan editing factor PgeF [Anaerolineae bacterium]|nr:peptidoglycan editing factor PgeF [Anaerolineae bacterium]
MQRVEQDSMVFYQSDLFKAFPNVIHAVTTRHGGVSPAPFDSLNLSSHVGDSPDNVMENMERFHRALGLERRTTVDAHQAQADRVARVTVAERGTRIQGVDGLITNLRGIPLMLRYADCVPILLYDPTHQAIGIAHAGWRGTVGKIVTNTVKAMQDAFGTEPSQLITAIGPSIGPCCYEIGADVRERVEAAFAGKNELLLARNGTLHLDLWQANAVQLRALGVEQIDVAGVCTADHTDDFYSWRREQAKTGRFAAVIALR